MHFHKYQGAGNDFILIDNRSGEIQLSTEQIRLLCDRRFGIGADGLMLLNRRDSYDFEMKYFNADGHAGSLCGNGGRCIVRFAFDLGIKKETYHFLASDGDHQATILPNGQISLQMLDVTDIRSDQDEYILDTGSPHVVRFVEGLDELDVFSLGKSIRHEPRFAPKGINVNFVERTDRAERIRVRTFERGVEDETLACGTGVTACALALAIQDQKSMNTILDACGGTLQVEYQTSDFKTFTNIRLIGPAEKVFEVQWPLLP